VYIIIGFLNMMLHLNTMFAVFTTVLVFLVYILELFVAILQAYVYISLITLYLKDTYELPSH
jgi:F0F1-type ATP synthase membrane subunit a